MRRFVICLIVIVFASTTVYAVDENTITLNIDKNNVKVDDNFNVNINLNQLYEVYGLHVKVKFEPQYIIVNEDSLKISEELSTKKHFIALNSVDNVSGIIEFVFTLLGDENAFKSNFSIGSIGFRCIKAGDTNIQIKNSKALTKEGKTINHDVKNLTLSIMPKVKDSSMHVKNEIEPLSDQAPENTNHTVFTDIENNWAKDYIIKLSSMGIINGVSAEEFNPNAFITRCELAKIIGLSLDLENMENTNYKTNFIDEAVIPSWAIHHVDKLAQLGIICGYNDNTFKPNKAITRVELAVMLSRILKDSNSYTTEQIFTDDHDIPDWGNSSVYIVKKLGIMNGYKDGSFKPNIPVTRAEVCKIMVKILEVLNTV